LTGLPGILPVQLDDRKEQRVDEGDIPRRPLAPECAIEQLMGDNRRDRDVCGVLLPHAPRQATNQYPAAIR
jgi:hypothetical protein